MMICQYCNIEFNTNDKRRKFCSRSCAAKFNNHDRSMADQSREKTSESMKKYWSDKKRASREKKCLCCKKTFIYKDKRRKYCSRSCAAKDTSKIGMFRSKSISESMKYWQEHPEERVDVYKRSQRGKHKNPKHIFEVSKRTLEKILRRLNIGCSNCGWDLEVCDMHHIVPVKNGGNNGHLNLSYLYPNCHRLAHTGKLDRVMNFQDQVGDNWKEFYYG